MRKSSEIREAFLNFFIERGHTKVMGSPLIPPDDPTMLFTSAGMVQFKSLYAGTVELPYRRATSVQKCLRAGGKGSDLENVGKTLRHHTFFEMLGNFSFGDYFKREAIKWAWEFVTEVLKLPRERLFSTIFRDDDESAKIWKEETDCPYEPARLDEKGNFWGPAGETGACGPCSEICFFMGSREDLDFAKRLPPEKLADEIDKKGDLYLEIWNMVFPQFDQQIDGTRLPLKNRGIDTGAGLERMTTVTQFVESQGLVRSPYETDLLFPIVNHITKLTDLKYEKIVEQMTREGASFTKISECKQLKTRLAINAIADHIRALTFALSEGILPSNDGRGYVLRRILRRALRFAYLQGIEKPFLYELVDTVVDLMGEYYPEIKKNPSHIIKVIRIEEERFLKTISQGEKFLEEMIQKAKETSMGIISGKNVFLLHATYGFPPDLTGEIVEDNGLKLDRNDYEKEMAQHREEAKKSWQGGFSLVEEEEILDDIFEQYGATKFLGYEFFESQGKILALIKNSQRVESLKAGDEGIIVLSQTPFYAESGGQIGDAGQIKYDNNVFIVSDTKKTPSSIFLHLGKLEIGELKIGDNVIATIDNVRRLAIARNHTATHLLQGALKRILGAQITQQGSSVTPEGFRFDFTHLSALTDEEIEKIEEVVNDGILLNDNITTEILPIEEALKKNVIAPFGEKYGATVRVIRIGDFSAEFCGGTHLKETSQIGSFVIVGESSIASGVRRIEATTGYPAQKFYAERKKIVNNLCQILTSKPDEITDRVRKIQIDIKSLKKSLAESKQKSSANLVDDIISSAKEIKGVNLITHLFSDLSPADLRNTADVIKNKTRNTVIVLGSSYEGKASLLCTITDDLKGKIHSGNVIKEIAKIVDGGGGGKPELAQAGGKDPSKLGEALEKAGEILEITLP